MTGTLIRTGPGQFEVGKQSYQHWFDGLALLRKFSFQDRQVSLTTKFLESQAYLESQAKNKISRGEFGTVARRSLWERLRDPLPRLTDSATVNITMMDDRFVSVTESPMPIEFDPETLSTLGQFHYHDAVKGQITTAHPHFDFQRNTSFSYVTNLAPPCTYNLYSMAAHEKERRLLGAVAVKQPAYMHSFGMTEHYLILAEFPFVLNRLELLLSGKPFNENCHWTTDRGTRFQVISKADGRLVATCESESFFAFHHVNAFEQDQEILLDLVAYPDASVVRSLYLDPLRHQPDRVIAVGELRRYCIPLNGADAHSEVLSAEKTELTRINYPQHNAQPYRFVYGVGQHLTNNFIDQLVKVNVENGTAEVWHSENCYPGEPVFVAAPNARTEDEGVILSVVLNAEKSNSFLLVLDAQSFHEIARAEVPHHLPFDFHGQYFETIADSTQRNQLHR